MPKKEKHPKPRPDKYAEKVAINTSFEQTLKIFAAGANKKTKESIARNSDSGKLKK
ncbi:MAG: hypothetical protein JST70_16905 [Bacteroidetes bacterium]|nr:hypothetical protein [Bacteroidota bacterium]